MKKMMLTGLLMLLAVTAAHAADGDLEAKIRELQKAKKAKIMEIADKNKESIVIVEIVVKATVSFNGQQRPAQEQKLRLNGTMISQDGTTVVSNSRSDPMAQLGSRAKNMPGLKIDMEVLESKIILNDGTEVPAKVVLKDADLDLAFVKPDEPQKDMAHVTLCPDCKPEILDSVISVTRLDLEANRTVVIKSGSIGGIIEKPRKYYVGASSNPGLPAFNKDGKCFGLFLRRMGTSGPTGGPVILPAEEILTAVKQLKEKARAPKTDPKEEKKEE